MLVTSQLCRSGVWVLCSQLTKWNQDISWAWLSSGGLGKNPLPTASTLLAEFGIAGLMVTLLWSCCWGGRAWSAWEERCRGFQASSTRGALSPLQAERRLFSRGPSISQTTKADRIVLILGIWLRFCHQLDNQVFCALFIGVPRKLEMNILCFSCDGVSIIHCRAGRH